MFLDHSYEIPSRSFCPFDDLTGLKCVLPHHQCINRLYPLKQITVAGIQKFWGTIVGYLEDGFLGPG